MRILTLNYEYPPLGGGASPVAAALAEQLASQGHELEVVTMGYRGLPRHEVRSGVAIHRVPCLRRRVEVCNTPDMATYLLPAYLKARSLARSRPFDLIHAHFIFPTGVVAAALRRTLKLPLLVSIHGSDVPGYNPHRFQLQHRLLKPLWRKVVAQVDMLVSPSKAVGELLRHNAHPTELSERLTVVPHGITPFPYEPERKAVGKVLMSGRLLERKGFRTMLKALQQHPLDFDLHIVGDGPDRALLEQMARGLQTPVTFHGWLDNTSDAYRDLFSTSSIFVFPTQMDNFPVVLMEAMSAGLAVITTNAGGCGEVVGDTAEFIPVDDPGQLAAKLAGLLADPQQVSRMGEAAHQRVLDEFSWPQIAASYEKLYDLLLAADQKGSAGD